VMGELQRFVAEVQPDALTVCVPEPD
jgi:hypothetical protein